MANTGKVTTTDQATTNSYDVPGRRKRGKVKRSVRKTGKKKGKR